MKTNKTRMRRLVWALLAGTSALLLATALSLLLSHFQALAQPVAEAPVANLKMETAVLSPTSQTRSPEKGALITQKGTLAIEGVAWEGGNRPPFPDDPVLLPINNNYGPNYIVGWTDAVSATYYVLYEADNPYFENATLHYSGPLTETFLADQADGTYYYHVKAYNASGESRWSNVESAVVGTGSVSALTTPIETAASDSITVWVRIDDSDWHTATITATDWGGWEWSYEWSLPEQNYVQHAIHTQASDADGSFGPVDTITVTLRNGDYIIYFPIIFKRWPPIPYAPTLDNIDNTDENGDYTVSWSYNDDSLDVPDPTAYTLQEATDANFTNPTEHYHDGSGNTSHEFTDQDEGTYYYRVQGHNEHGPGEWSSVKSATVVSSDFFDNFSSSNSGWTTHKSQCCLTGCDSARQHLDYKYDLYYEGGWYHVNVPLDCRGGGNHGDTRHIYPVSFAPGVERSTSETCIELKGRFEEWNPYWSFWGLVFAASEDMSTVYSLEVNNLGDWGIVKRTGYQYPGPNHPFENETRTNIVPYIGEQRWPAKAGFTSNTLMARVTNKKVKLYINGEEVYSFSEEILSLKRVGIIGGNWEITPTQIGYDYFLVDEGCDDY